MRVITERQFHGIDTYARHDIDELDTLLCFAERALNTMDVPLAKFYLKRARDYSGFIRHEILCFKNPR